MPCRRPIQAVTALAVVEARQEFNDVEMSIISFKEEPLFPMGWTPMASRLRRTVCETQTWAWLLALARTSVPIPVRSPEKESHLGTMGHVSVPFRHASGGAAYSPMGVGVRSIQHIASERGLF